MAWSGMEDLKGSVDATSLIISKSRFAVADTWVAEQNHGARTGSKDDTMGRGATLVI